MGFGAPAATSAGSFGIGHAAQAGSPGSLPFAESPHAAASASGTRAHSRPSPLTAPMATGILRLAGALGAAELAEETPVGFPGFCVGAADETDGRDRPVRHVPADLLFQVLPERRVQLQARIADPMCPH